MLRLKFSEALMDMSKFLLAFRHRTEIEYINVITAHRSIIVGST